MKLVCTSLYNRKKTETINTYPCFKKYFEDLENLIVSNPEASKLETILYNGKHVHSYRKSIKTTFFSGLLPDTYIYLTITYAPISDKRILLMYVHQHDYIN